MESSQKQHDLTKSNDLVKDVELLRAKSLPCLPAGLQGNVSKNYWNSSLVTYKKIILL